MGVRVDAGDGGRDRGRGPERSATGTTFVHRATDNNTFGNSTYVDYPSANDNPNPVLLVTPVRDAEDEVNNPHPIGVWYDRPRSGKWAIFNQDSASMPEGAAFNLAVSGRIPKRGEGAVTRFALLGYGRLLLTTPQQTPRAVPLRAEGLFRTPRAPVRVGAAQASRDNSPENG